MWFSTELKDFLGKFTAPTAGDPVAPFHHVVKHGSRWTKWFLKLASHLKKNFYSLTTAKPARANVQSFTHILIDLVASDSIGKERGTIATCRLPIDGNGFTLPPGDTKWKPPKRTDSISDFRISIMDERGELLAYKGGNFSIVIRTRPKK